MDLYNPHEDESPPAIGPADMTLLCRGLRETQPFRMPETRIQDLTRDLRCLNIDSPAPPNSPTSPTATEDMAKWLDELPGTPEPDLSTQNGATRKRKAQDDGGDDEPTNHHRSLKRTKVAETAYRGSISEPTTLSSRMFADEFPGTVMQSVVPTPKEHRGMGKFASRALHRAKSTIFRTETLADVPSIETHVRTKRLRFAFFGDTKSGKTSLIQRFCRGWYFGENLYTETILEYYNRDVEIGGVKTNIESWDTCGAPQACPLESVKFLQVDAIFVCFSVARQENLTAVIQKWIPQAKSRYPDTPIFLIGTMMDMRLNPLHSEANFRTAAVGVAASQGERVAKKLGCEAYLECSAKDDTRIADVFCIAAAITMRKEEEGKQADDEKVAKQAKKEKRKTVSLFSFGR